MAILCPDHNLLYIRVPATGRSVVASALQDELDGRSVPERPVRQNGRTVVKRTHCTVPEPVEHGVLSREIVEECMVFANVRNPFDRWMTYYQRWVVRELDRVLSERPAATSRAGSEGLRAIR